MTVDICATIELIDDLKKPMLSLVRTARGFSYAMKARISQ
nr:MAG TPA: hypothetical protein [Bacteriophage sp.]